MKPIMIKLTEVRGDTSRVVYVNAASIQRYWESTDGGTVLVFNNCADIIVKESPNAIFQVVLALTK